MKNVKVEDSVYCMVRGEGKVISVCQDTIRVVFNPCLGTVDFNLDGTCKEFGWEGTKRTLYYSEPEFDIPPEPERPVMLHGYEIKGFRTNNEFRRHESSVVVAPHSPEGCVEAMHSVMTKESWDHMFQNHLLYPASVKGRINAKRHAQILLGTYNHELQQSFDNFESGDNIL